MTFKVDPNKAAALAFRQTKIAFLILSIVPVIISILLNSYSKLVLIIVLVDSALLVGIIFKIVYLRMVVYTIDDEKVGQAINNSENDPGIEFMRQRNTNRYGVKDEKTILFTDITKIVFKGRDIHVYTRGNDFLTHNNRITIPIEIENFDQAKALLEAIQPLSVKNC